jgi:Ras-related protein Rab-1A
MTDNNSSDSVYKVLLLGDSTVGKTCFLMRYTDNTFQEIHMSTIGLDYRLKTMTLNSGKQVKVQIWDTAGQDRFRAITKNYYKGAHGIILIYDVTNQITFDNVTNWITQIKEEASDKVTIFLVGNKIDDEKNRKVETEEGKKLAEEFKLKFYETSAKIGTNVETTFKDLVQIIDEVSAQNNNLKGGKLTKNSGKKKPCC